MAGADPRNWMWAEACAMIERAEQMHRQFFQPGSAAAPAASWEPPIDVFESEPPLQGHALLRLENCICTPHIGYVEQDSYEMYFGQAFDNVVSFIKGNPTNIINPGALQVRR